MAKPINPPITDHEDRAIARSVGFTLESPNLNKLRRALNVGTQNIENVLDDFLNKQAISTAVGVQLDNIGTILDLRRITGQSDASYASDLLGRAGNLATSGTMNQLLDVLNLLYSPSFIYAFDLFPATFEMIAITEDDGDPTDEAVLAAMGGAKAAGVGMSIQLVQTPEFFWGAEADVDANGDLPPGANGFGDDADADGAGDILPGVGGGNLTRALI